MKKEFLIDPANVSGCAHEASSSPDPPDPTRNCDNKTVASNMLTSRGVSLRGTASFRSVQLIQLSERLARKPKFPSVSVCKAASFPGQRTEAGCY